MFKRKPVLYDRIEIGSGENCYLVETHYRKNHYETTIKFLSNEKPNPPLTAKSSLTIREAIKSQKEYIVKALNFAHPPKII